MEKLKQIIRGNRMSTRPEYYSGRGATLSDLDYNILEGIYKGIKIEFGESAANSFVDMVDNIKVMSATTFLQELYMLFYNDWVYVIKEKDASGIAVAKNEDGDYDMLSGIMGIFGGLTSNQRDETPSIKNHFLFTHGKSPENNYIHYY
jgi:hypothetical protein